MDGLVNIDDSHAGFNGDLSAFFIDFYDAVHGAHVKQRLAVIECQVAVAPSGPASANRHVAPAAVGQGFAALFQGCWARNKGARANRADQ